MGERLESLETEPFAAEREWTVEGVPVLSAAAQVPEPAGKDRTARRIRRVFPVSYTPLTRPAHPRGGR